MRAGMVVPVAGGLLVVAGLFSVQTVLRNRDWHDLHRLFATALETYPEDPNALEEMGIWYLRQNQSQEAVNYLEKSVRVIGWGGDPRGIIALADAHMRIGKPEDYGRATALLEQLTGRVLQPGAPEMTTALEDLGIACMHTGREREAIEAFEHTLALKPPSTSDIMNNLAWLYVTGSDPELRNAQRGLELATAAVRFWPDNPDYLDTLAHAYQANNRTGEAIATVERIIGLLPADSARVGDCRKLLEELKKGVPGSESDR
jgi:tetratricopeptide (TPR) repeat protein